MLLTARDLMQTNLVSVPPTLTLPQLEERFLEDGVSGYPVLEKDRLVGIVSRSDIVRRLCLERSSAEHSTDFYHFSDPVVDSSIDSFDDIAKRVGKRVEGLHVHDVMVRLLITVRPSHSVHHVARALVDNRIHRVLVTEDQKLRGIISSTDLVRLLADGETEDPMRAARTNR